jgi:hypothetical protein
MNNPLSQQRGASVTTKTTAAKTRYYADLDDAAEAAQAKADKTGRPQYVNHKPNGFTVDAKAAKQLMATRIPAGSEAPEKADPATASKPKRTAKTRAEARAADPNQSSPLGAENVRAASASLDKLESGRRATEEEYVAARKAEQARRRDEANAHIAAIHEREMAAIKAANARAAEARKAPAKDRDVVASDAPAGDVTRCQRCGAQLVTNLKGRRGYTCGAVILDKGGYELQDAACETYRTAARMGFEASAYAEKFAAAEGAYAEAVTAGADKAAKLDAARALVEVLNEGAAHYDLPDLGDLTTKVLSGWWRKRIEAAVDSTRARVGAGETPAPGAKVIHMVEVPMPDGTTGLRHRDGLVVFAS